MVFILCVQNIYPLPLFYTSDPHYGRKYSVDLVIMEKIHESIMSAYYLPAPWTAEVAPPPLSLIKNS